MHSIVSDQNVARVLDLNLATPEPHLETPTVARRPVALDDRIVTDLMADSSAEVV